MASFVPPPDFRYVGLEPGPSYRSVALLAGGVGLGTCLLGVALGGGAELGTLTAAGGAGVVAAILSARLHGPTARWATQVPMAIVPWGVLVLSETAPRVLRWPAVRSVNVDFVHEMDHATPSTRWSVVTIATEREVLGGRTPGSVSLERLEAHLPSYAEEASRPLAGDLDGDEPLSSPLEPAFELLLGQARRLLHSGALSERLSLPPSSYRQVRTSRASSQAVSLLARVLRAPPGGPADPRALAAVLAAELGAGDLIDAVTPMTTSPNPLLAAVSRAAALRLGAPARRVGSLDEVSEFVPATDLEQIRDWALKRT
jgi:hypothetical protein